MAHKTMAPRLNLKYLGAVQIAPIALLAAKPKTTVVKLKIAAAKA